MSGQAINSIATIIKRLEAATSRLEDIAASSTAAPSGVTARSGSAADVSSGSVAASGSNAAASASTAATVASDPTAVTAFDESVAQSLEEYLALSTAVGGIVADQAKKVADVFAAQRFLIKVAASSAKPPGGVSSSVFAELIKPLQEPLIAVTELREKNRSERVLFNHLSAVSEGIPAAGWVTVEPKPGPFVNEMKDSAQFYTNRVIKEFKEKDKVQVEWCRSYIKLLETLKEYIMKYHTTGLSWNPKGGDATATAASLKQSASVADSGAPPPPPPPPPAPVFESSGIPPPPPPPSAAAAAGTGGAGSATSGGMDAVFSQLNQGEGITKGLKKVDASQMTHKNPELRNAAPPVAGSSGSSKPTPPRPGSKPAGMRPKKPAKTELEGNKWNVENHENNSSITIENTELSHTVNIFGCKNTVIQVKGKINAIAMVSCQKTSIVFDSLVSALEITSSPSFAVQVMGRVPTIVLDSCDSGQIYLSSSEAAAEAEIIASKCSALNVSIPKKGAEEVEYVELALPEQLRFSVTPQGTLKSEVVAHTG